MQICIAGSLAEVKETERRLRPYLCVPCVDGVSVSGSVSFPRHPRRNASVGVGGGLPRHGVARHQLQLAIILQVSYNILRRALSCRGVLS